MVSKLQTNIKIKYGHDNKKCKTCGIKFFLNFYSHLNMADITATSYTNSKKVCYDFTLKGLV